MSRNVDDYRQELNIYCNAYIVLCCIVTALSVAMTYVPYGENRDTLSMLADLIALILLLFVLGFCWRFVYTLWQGIPSAINDRDPYSMAWFTVIPFFYLYGCFPAFCGLCDKMNKSAQQLGRQCIAELAFSYTICSWWIFYFILSVVFVTILPDPSVFDPETELELWTNAAADEFAFNVCFNFIEVFDTIITCGYFLYLKSRMFALLQIGFDAYNASSSPR